VPPTFTLVGQTVFVDDLTVFANFTVSAPAGAAVASLIDGSTFVEVHGLRDATGALRASRVERLTPVAGNDELRGTVTALVVGTSFTLENGTTSVTVHFSGTTTIVPATATLANGEIVEVHGAFSGATFTATSINIEDDAQFEHQAGEEFEIEGQVSGCGVTNPCTSFKIGAQAVQVNANTQFERGAPSDIADGIRVEAEGHQFGVLGQLIAEKIEFKRTRVILTGQVTNTTGTLTAGTGHMGTDTVFGQVVQVTTLTDIRTNDSITNIDRVEVRGFVDSGGNIVADRVDDSPGGNGDIVQAPVTNTAGNVLTLLVGNTSLTADLTGVTQLSNENVAVNLAQFLAAVTPAPAPGGTIVKVKGTVSGSTITAIDEAEIED
jgi:hypothetical protein